MVSDLRPTMQPGLHDRNSEPARLMLGLLPDVQICSMHNVGETEDIALDAALDYVPGLDRLSSSAVHVISDPKTRADGACARTAVIATTMRCTHQIQSVKTLIGHDSSSTA